MCQHKFINIHEDYANDVLDTVYITQWCQLCGAYRENTDSEAKLSKGTIHYPESVRLYDLAKKYEEIEVMMLNHEDYWFDKMPDEIYDKMMEAQKLRCELLYPEESK